MHNSLISVIGLTTGLILLLLIPSLSPAQSEDEPDYIAEIESQFSVVDDPDIVTRVQTIRTRLITVIPEAETDEREVVVKVLDDSTINAFALPDGHVYIFKGLIEACETDDMLAGVMAHEFTHVYHRHHSGLSDRQLRGMLIGIAAMVATGEGEALMLGQMLSASMVETYGRSAENDADRTGAIWAVAAGYDPVGFLELMQILEQEAIHRPEPGGNYFTVHPNPDDRMANIREALEELGVKVPETIYRVHLSLRFYLPLSDAETERLAEWETRLIQRAEGMEDDESPDEESEFEDEFEDEIPPSLLTEYYLRRDLFEDIIPLQEGSYGVVVIGDTGVFYIANEVHGDADDLRKRSDKIVSRLGELFLGGLRSYEVQSRTIAGEPSLLARRKIIAFTTEKDAELLGLTPEEVNSERVEKLKDILYRYYVNRRI